MLGKTLERSLLFLFLFPYLHGEASNFGTGTDESRLFLKKKKEKRPPAAKEQTGIFTSNRSWIDLCAV